MEPNSQKISLEEGTMPRATVSPACPTPPLSNISGVALSDFAEADSGPSTPSSCAPSPATSEKSGRSSRASTSTTRSARKKDPADIGHKSKVLLNKFSLSGTEDGEDGRKSSASNPHSRSSTPDKALFGGGKRKNSAGSLGLESSSKKKKTSKASGIGASEQSTALNDNYCWECHREGEFICCEMCPRVFHLRCANLDSAPPQDWACHHCHAIMLADNVENRYCLCLLIMLAHNVENRSRAMQLISVDQLGMMLKFALNRAKKTPMVSSLIPI
ncbi:Zinc finger FYVE/PHD-type [Trinorchestia longiramus]|nr:Zinc finger FYVE/PHD-type [Trinorchestia longiramus]